MIRIILLALTASLSIVKAQYEPENYMSDNWAMEDMSNPYGAPSFGANQKGIYFWRPKDEWYFTTTMSRVADKDAADGFGYISFISTHTSGSYHPVGVGFGSNASGGQYTIDMSAADGDTVYFEAENVSNQDLNVRVGLKDVNNNLIDTKSGTPLTNIPAGIIDMVIPKYSIRSKKFVYHGGYYAEWGDVNKCTDWADPNNKSKPCAIKKFDFAKVVGANITINSTNPGNVGITNAELRIRKMEFGKKPVLVTIYEEENMADQTLIVSPNPATGAWVQFNHVLDRCVVLNAEGQVKLEKQYVDKLDVSMLKSGIYSIVSSSGTRKLVVE